MSNPEPLQGSEEKPIDEVEAKQVAELQLEPRLEKTEEAKEGDKHEKINESDEDVPGDFFDDFLKEDFMAGLDIVDDDEWDDVKIKIDKEDMLTKGKDDVHTLNKEKRDSIKKRKKQKTSSDSTEKKERRSKLKKKKEAKDVKDDKYKRSSDKQIDADEFDIRRDPEKTKRDIARDKVRCEKDKEMKIISEKLSMVETGLVPPGMEMELDIEEVKRQKEKLEVKSPRDLRERIRDLKERNRSPVPRQRSSPRRRSLPRKSPLSLKRASPHSRKRSRSPRPRDPLHLRIELSPLRSPRKSPLRRLSPRRISPRRISPRPRSSDRIHSRRKSRSHSPNYRNRRSRYSPYRHRNRSNSRDSDREKWLKKRNRSRSPRRKREEKKSFLQEIAEKLNEIRVPIMSSFSSVQQMQPMLQPMQPPLPPMQPPLPPIQPPLPPMQQTLHYIQPQPAPVPAPTPVPVPAPESVSLFPNSQQSYDPYDQNFFIGTPTMPNNFQSQLSPLQLPLIQTGDGKHVIAPSMSTPNANGVTPKKMEFANQLKRKPESKEDLEKLFQDKQITLSEFLAITAKPEVFSSSPKRVQEKIKVITRCHDAIKFLSGNEKKFSGKLAVVKTNNYKVLTGTTISPLMCNPPVLFPFTSSLLASNEQRNSFNVFMNKLLQKLGLLNEVVNIDDEDAQEPVRKGDEQQMKFPPPPPPLLAPIKSPYSNETKQAKHSVTKDNNLCKMVQTDIFKCQACEQRKKILTRSAAIQADSATTFSVSTQVTEEDFQPKLPKSKSLAALTPAQLLAKSRESLSAASRASRVEIDGFDIFAPGPARTNYFRAPDAFGLSRPALSPYSNSLIYDALNNQLLGGTDRPRTLDPRYTYNNFY